MLPKLFEILPTISRKQLINDLISGILVGIVALPLAIAFGIASGVSPEKGLITAVIGGFIVSLLGGSRVQIGGPTGAFIIIVLGIVQKYGINGLMVSTLIAGIFLIIMGFARFGSLIKYIPHPVIVGFTSGIAVVIFSTQIKDFLGLEISSVPGDFIGKWEAYFSNISTINWQALMIGLASLMIVIFWPLVSRKIPGSIIAILFATIVVAVFKLDVPTIASKFGAIPSTIPAPRFPHLTWELVHDMLLPGLTIAMLAAIEALLSAVVADGMIGKRHKSNTELIAQGVANVISPLFGGIPVTGAIARTATNVKNGGRTPIAGLIHAVTLLLIMLVLGKWAKLIPLPTLAAILIMVSYNMSEHHVFRRILKSPRSDVLVLLSTFLLTVFFDLTIAIEVGMVLAVILFMKRMASISNVDVITNSLVDKDEQDDLNNIKSKDVPDRVEVYEVYGPFFFGAATTFKDSIKRLEEKPLVRIIRMRHVPTIDATGLNLLRELYIDSYKDGITLLLSGVNSHTKKILHLYGLDKEIGLVNIHDNIDDSLSRARDLLENN
jgi:SulP family sulfate permease